MSWKIIRPAECYNYVLNPQAGVDDYYAVAGTSAVERSSSYAAHGLCSFKVTNHASGDGIVLYTTDDLPSAVDVSFLARGVTGTLTVNIGVLAKTAELIAPVGDGWSLYAARDVSATDTEAFIMNTSGNDVWYIDAIMICDAGAYLQTYVDGEQEDCVWLGERHREKSYRPATTRAGGEIIDLEDDLYYRVTFPTGGVTNISNTIASRPLRPGASVESASVLPSSFVLPGVLVASSMAQLHERLVALTDLVMPDRVPEDEFGRPQAVRLQYWGSERILEFAGHYQAGLDGVQVGTNMRIALSFLGANQPFWREIIERTIAVTTSNSETVRLVFRRTGDGTWDVMGPPASVGLDPDSVVVNAIAANERYIYIGGRFLNLDGIALADKIARYDTVESRWEAVVTTAPPDDTVRALLLDAAGNLYVGGDFTIIDGLTCNGFAKRAPTGGWYSYGGGTNGNVWALEIDEAGHIYLGGSFTSAGGVSCNYVARFSGSSYSAVGDNSLNDAVYALCYLPTSNRLYAGGAFREYIKYCELPSGAWTALGVGSPNGIVSAICAYGADGLVVGGSFTTVGSYESNRLFIYLDDWRHAGHVIPFPVGADNYVASVTYATSNNYVYVAGEFTTFDNISTPAGVFRFHPQYPFVVEPLPIVTDDVKVHTVYVPSANRRVGRQDVIYGLHGTAAGTLYIPGNISAVTTSVSGGAQSRPVIRLIRSGTDNANVRFIENSTTDKRILLNQVLQDGEELVIDTEKLLIYSRYYDIVRSIIPQPGSQFATFALLPSANSIYIYVYIEGGSVDGAISWRQQYHSFMAGDI